MAQKFNLWENTPGMCEEVPTITYYEPINKKSDAAIVIFPGGGYGHRAGHEGKDYAEFYAENGISAFVVDYRVAPHRFPLPLLDARRAVRYVRFYAEKFGIDKNKIAVMGSSAGGHLAAMVSTYYNEIDFEGVDEIDFEDFVPNKQILCYPVIRLLGKEFSHLGSGRNLLAEQHACLGEDLSPDLIASEYTPDAFMWHTFNDNVVNVKNTLKYAEKLKSVGASAEVHIFPEGNHGLGLCKNHIHCEGRDPKMLNHVMQWTGLILNWLKYIGYLAD